MNLVTNFYANNYTYNSFFEACRWGIVFHKHILLDNRTLKLSLKNFV